MVVSWFVGCGLIVFAFRVCVVWLYDWCGFLVSWFGLVLCGLCTGVPIWILIYTWFADVAFRGLGGFPNLPGYAVLRVEWYSFIVRFLGFEWFGWVLCLLGV